MLDETMQNNLSHVLDHHSKLFFHHHIKMLVNFSEKFFLNYKLTFVFQKTFWGNIMEISKVEEIYALLDSFIENCKKNSK